MSSPQPQSLPLPPALAADGGMPTLDQQHLSPTPVAGMKFESGEHPPSDTESLTQKTTARRESEGFIAFTKGFDQCEVTPEAINPVKKDTTTKGGRVNHSPMTPLKGIAGHSVQVLKIDDLRMFCSRNQIKGSRKAKKADICWAICRAKAQQMGGDPGPYKDLIPQDSGSGDVDEETKLLGSGGVLPMAMDDPAAVYMADAVAVDSSDPARKKRRVEDASIPLPNPGKANANEVMSLHRRLVKSKEDTNLAIQLREMVESSATLRRELREEKDRRASLWKQLVEQTAGGEGAAIERIKGYAPSCGDGIKWSGEILAEDVIEIDGAIRQMTSQYAALSKAVDRLTPQDLTVAETVAVPAPLGCGDAVADV